MTRSTVEGVPVTGGDVEAPREKRKSLCGVGLNGGRLATTDGTR